MKCFEDGHYLSQAKLSDRKPADYLRDLPRLPESSVSNGSLVHSELLRVARGTPLAALDLVRYSLNKPDASKLGDLRAWQAALDNAHSQLQHQDNRLLNLELLLKYGTNAWRAQNEALSSHLAHLQAQLTSTRKAVDALNQERKLQQTAAGKELGTLEAEYISLVSKNQELEAECNALEAEVSKMENEGD